LWVAGNLFPVTCIQFNPVDEHYFLSGAFDDKVRIWSIPDHQVVDWTDLGERVTALCYTPNGKRAIVGSYKGTCRYFNTTGLNSPYQLYKVLWLITKIAAYSIFPNQWNELNAL
jgi:WD40 repeat protein